jgi:alkanesulfonate monooxygenase SsuD/methylene tetrahydromethanopterin reductase-like flavin-dependent oxidoreductase (luciferase family)
VIGGGAPEQEGVGVQIAPWSAAPEILAAARRLAGVVDIIWVQDQMLARNVYALLAGVAATSEVGVGTNVTFPFGRNPIEIAASAATIAELVPTRRPLVLGLGTGGALVNSLFARAQPITTVRESVALLRRLWAGDAVPLDDYPALGGVLGYRAGAVARLTFPVTRPIPILFAGIGPHILELAGEVADGIISASNCPTHSYAAFKSGKFDALAGLDYVQAGRAGQERPFRMVFGLNCCVSRDRAAAKAFARRQLALVAGNPALWPGLEAVGLDVDSARDVKAAFDRGEGIEGGVARMSDSLLDGLIVSGDPDEALIRLEELRGFARAAGYTDFYLGAPLGPSLTEAAEIIADVLVPELWPSRVTLPA